MEMIIIPQGQEPKFKVSIKDFDMRYGEFQVTLIYGYRRSELVIGKEDMVTDDDWNFYFGFDTSNMTGQVFARCEWQVPDDDYPDHMQSHVNEQMLCFVASNPCPMFICAPCKKDDSEVTYTLTSENNISQRYMALMDKEHNYILTADNERILVLKK